jgi:hypothetical protein
MTTRGDVTTAEARPVPAHPAGSIPAGPMLSRLGHELRSPLNGIMGLTRIMLMKLAAGPVEPAEQIRPLEVVQVSAGQLLTTVDREDASSLATSATLVVENLWFTVVQLPPDGARGDPQRPPP